MATKKAKETVQEGTVLPVEEKKPEIKIVAVVGCNDAELKESLMATAKAKGEDVVILALPDEVIAEYLKNTEPKEPKTESQRLKEFIDNDLNRKEATNKAVQLFTILMGENASLDAAKDKIFSETEVVKKTTLSHSKARQLFELFSTFGLIEFTDKLHFKLIFTPEHQHEIILKGMKALTDAVRIDMLRLQNSLSNDPGLTADKRKEIEKRMVDMIVFTPTPPKKKTATKKK